MRIGVKIKNINKPPAISIINLPKVVGSKISKTMKSHSKFEFLFIVFSSFNLSTLI